MLLLLKILFDVSLYCNTNYIFYSYFKWLSTVVLIYCDKIWYNNTKLQLNSETVVFEI